MPPEPDPAPDPAVPEPGGEPAHDAPLSPEHDRRAAKPTRWTIVLFDENVVPG
jgi:hypothetical protein